MVAALLRMCVLANGYRAATIGSVQRLLYPHCHARLTGSFTDGENDRLLARRDIRGDLQVDLKCTRDQSGCRACILNRTSDTADFCGHAGREHGKRRGGRDLAVHAGRARDTSARGEQQYVAAPASRVGRGHNIMGNIEIAARPTGSDADRADRAGCLNRSSWASSKKIEAEQ
jgi:hypothetical protein